MSDRASWVYTAIGALANTSQLFEYEQEKQVLAICKKAMAQYDKEQAVIEAAREWHKYGDWSVEFEKASRDLARAVEALNKAEAGT